MLLVYLLHGGVVRGVNQTLDLIPDARSSGVAAVQIGLPGELSHIASHGASLLDINSYSINVSHTEYFLGDQFDWLAGAYRLDSLSVIGVSLSRFSSSEIPYTEEGDTIAFAPSTFEISDWSLSTAIARKIFDIQFGTNLHLIKRDLDQNGLGFRGDISVNWTKGSFILGAHVKGISSSAVKWEDHWEYAPPDLFFGFGFSKDIPYLYGKLYTAWQSKGVFQKEAKASDVLLHQVTTDSTKAQTTLIGERSWEAPLDFFKVSSVAIEFHTNWDLILRGGLEEIALFQNYSLGIGVPIWSHLYVDYGFQSHSELGVLHKLSMHFDFGRSLRNPQKARTKSDAFLLKTKEEKPKTSQKIKFIAEDFDPNPSKGVITETIEEAEEVLEEN